jgi:hypothetical protein
MAIFYGRANLLVSRLDFIADFKRRLSENILGRLIRRKGELLWDVELLWEGEPPGEPS